MGSAMVSLALERHDAADAEMAALGFVESAVVSTIVDMDVLLCIYMDRLLAHCVSQGHLLAVLMMTVDTAIALL